MKLFRKKMNYVDLKWVLEQVGWRMNLGNLNTLQKKNLL
jgi:hypothetical protein